MLQYVTSYIRRGLEMARIKQRQVHVIGSVLRTIVVAVAIMVGAGLLANAKITINVDHIIQPLETMKLDETEAVDSKSTNRTVLRVIN